MHCPVRYSTNRDIEKVIQRCRLRRFREGREGIVIAAIAHPQTRGLLRLGKRVMVIGCGTITAIALYGVGSRTLAGLALKSPGVVAFTG